MSALWEAAREQDACLETGMNCYPMAALERTMKIQEVILRALTKKITWWQAAEIIGITDRQMRRWHWRYKEVGFDGLRDRRLGKPSPRRGPLAVVEQVFSLYREKYFDLNVCHFHEKRGAEAGVHRRKRERRPLPGMLLHIDGSRHHWFQDDRWYDLLVILDDATSRIYYAQLVEEESTMTVLGALRKVVEQEGVFCALYSDRASHFFWTPRAGGKVDPERLTQVGRALKELGIGMIPAYSPQARGRSERSFGTWQGRLPQELRLRGMGTLEQANAFLEHEYTAEFNQQFQVPALQVGSAFLPCQRKDLDVLFSVQQTRVVSRDNTVVVGGKTLQIGATRWRGTLAGCSVTVCEHLDQSWSIRYGPHVVGRYNAEGWPLLPEPKQNGRGKTVEKPLRGKVLRTFPPRLEIPPKPRDSHFPTVTTAALSQPQTGHIVYSKKRTF